MYIHICIIFVSTGCLKCLYRFFIIPFCFKRQDLGKRVIPLDYINTEKKQKRFDISATFQWVGYSHKWNKMLCIKSCPHPSSFYWHNALTYKCRRHVYVLKLCSKYDMETSKIKKGKSKTTYFFFFILSLSKWNEKLF